jgi:hypothetical protein
MIKGIQIQQIGRGIFEACAPIPYLDIRGVTRVVPTAFETDLGTIPRPLRWMIDPALDIRAFIIHDYEYVSQKITRLEADKQLLSMLIEDKYTKSYEAYSIYYAVRAAGWWYWNRGAHRSLELKTEEAVIQKTEYTLKTDIELQEKKALNSFEKKHFNIK